MKKTNENPLNRFLLILTKIDLSANMFTMSLVCTSVHSEWAAFESLFSAFERLDTEIEKAIDLQKLKTPGLVRKAKEFLSELEVLKKEPDSEKENIPDFIAIAEKDANTLITSHCEG